MSWCEKAAHSDGLVKFCPSQSESRREHDEAFERVKETIDEQRSTSGEEGDDVERVTQVGRPSIKEPRAVGHPRLVWVTHNKFCPTNDKVRYFVRLGSRGPRLTSAIV